MGLLAEHNKELTRLTARVVTLVMAQQFRHYPTHIQFACAIFSLEVDT